jgi:hypothetical protein
MTALALSMPMVYFSRAPYTEPTAMAGVFGGIILLLAAFKSRKLITFVLAGLLAGVSAIARIDGLLAVTGMVFAVGLAASFSRDSDNRAMLRRGLVAFAVSACAMSLLGFYDVTHNSPSYYHSERHGYVPLYLGFTAITIGSIVLTLLPLGAIRTWLDRGRASVARIALVAILVVSAIMASRPLWWIARFNDPAGYSTVANRQRGAGLKIDPKRSYDEHTVSWLAWYLSWPVIITAAVGLALLGAWLFTRRDMRVLVLLTTFATVSVYYLNKATITPDQIWASRRLLPVVMPGVLIAAAVVPLVISRRKQLMWLAGSVAVLLAILPALSWRHLWDQAEFQGELNGALLACHAVDQVSAGDPHRYVVFAGSVPGTGFWTPTLEIMCNSTVLSVHDASRANLIQVRKNWGNKPVTVIMFNDENVPWQDDSPPQPAYTTRVTIWSQPLTGRPSGTASIQNTFWLGSLLPDGTVAPLPAS